MIGAKANVSRAALSVQKTQYHHEFDGYCCHSVTSSLYFGLSDTNRQFNGQVVGLVSCSMKAKIDPSAFLLGPDQESQESLFPRQNMLGSARKNRQLVGQLHAGCSCAARVERKLSYAEGHIL